MWCVVECVALPRHRAALAMHVTSLDDDNDADDDDDDEGEEDDEHEDDEN